MIPIRTREPEFVDRLKYLALGMATVAPMAIAVMVAPDKILFALPVVFALLGVLIWWHARRTAYHCRHCGHEFVVSVWKDAFSPHMWESKYLRCPECDKRSWARALVLEE